MYTVCLSHKLPGYLQVLSRSKRSFSRLQCGQFWYQKADTKDVLNSQEYKMWKKLSQYNIEILYILTRALYRIAIYRCIDTLAIWYILYRSFELTDTSCDTFLLKFRVFWSLKFPNFNEILFGLNQIKCIVDTYRISLHVYRDIIVSLKINDTEP